MINVRGLILLTNITFTKQMRLKFLLENPYCMTITNVRWKLIPQPWTRRLKRSSTLHVLPRD